LRDSTKLRSACHIKTRAIPSTPGARADELRIHDLRRALGRWQAVASASLAIIGKSLNHRSISTTAIYARLNINPVRESVNRATAAMLAILENGAEVLQFKKKTGQ
jgi:site-specific recombinase XerC